MRWGEDLLVQICVGHSHEDGDEFSLFIKGMMKHDAFHLVAKMILKAVEFLICLMV